MLQSTCFGPKPLKHFGALSTLTWKCTNLSNFFTDCTVCYIRINNFTARFAIWRSKQSMVHYLIWTTKEGVELLHVGRCKHALSCTSCHAAICLQFCKDVSYLKCKLAYVCQWSSISIVTVELYYILIRPSQPNWANYLCRWCNVLQLCLLSVHCF